MRALVTGVTEPPCVGERNCYRGGINRCTITRGSPKKYRQILKQPCNLPVMELQVFEQRSFVAGMWIQHGRDEPLDRADLSSLALMASSVLTIWMEDATTLSITHALMRAFCGLHVIRSRRSFDVADHQRLHFDNIACDLVGGPVSLHEVFRHIDRGFHGRSHELVC